MQLFNTDISDLTIGIIGGEGLMGSLFKTVLEKQGLKVIISDRDTKLSNQELTNQSDIVIISVPIMQTEAVIEEILPHTRQHQLLMDLTSLKQFPTDLMLKGNAEVIGLHPMFGHGVDSFEKQNIIVCPARSTHTDVIKKLLTNTGAQIHETTPEKHDEIMAIVQVLIHFNTIMLGNVMRNLNVDLDEIQKYMSPVYRLEFDVIARIFSQDPNLYGPILMKNPFKEKIMETLIKQSSDLKQSVSHEDQKTFTQEFIETREFLGDMAKDALDESNTIIHYLKNL